MKENSVRIVLKQLDYSLSISITKAIVDSPHRNLELIT